MADQLPAWFIHAVSDNVLHLGQQKQTMGMAAVTVREGVVGKTFPFQRMAKVAMTETLVRDGDTQYLNPTLSKRRANLRDFTAAMLIDEFDEIKTLTDPKSEFAQSLAWARNRTLDELLLSVAGLGTAGAAGVAVGGILGAGHHGGRSGRVVRAGRAARRAADRGRWHEPHDGEDPLREDHHGSERHRCGEPLFLLLAAGDEEAPDRYAGDLLGLHHHLRADARRLPERRDVGRVHVAHVEPAPDHRQHPLVHRGPEAAVGMAVGLIKNVEIDKAVHKNNNDQVLIKLSAGAVRREDAGVVQVNIDESVA